MLNSTNEEKEKDKEKEKEKEKDKNSEDENENEDSSSCSSHDVWDNVELVERLIDIDRCVDKSNNPLNIY